MLEVAENTDVAVMDAPACLARRVRDPSIKNRQELPWLPRRRRQGVTPLVTPEAVCRTPLMPRTDRMVEARQWLVRALARRAVAIMQREKDECQN